MPASCPAGNSDLPEGGFARFLLAFLASDGVVAKVRLVESRGRNLQRRQWLPLPVHGCIAGRNLIAGDRGEDAVPRRRQEGVDQLGGEVHLELSRVQREGRRSGKKTIVGATGRDPQWSSSSAALGLCSPDYMYQSVEASAPSLSCLASRSLSPETAVCSTATRFVHQQLMRCVSRQPGWAPP